MNRASIHMTLLTVMALAWPHAALSAPKMILYEEAIEGGRLVSLKRISTELRVSAGAPDAP